MSTAPTVAIIGAGASGTLTAAHLIDAAAVNGRALRLVLVEPDEPGSGVAYSTRDRRHRLNVQTAGMSAFPDDPEHFLRWLRRHVDPAFAASGYASRMDYGCYLSSVFKRAVRRAASVDVEIVTARASDLREHGRRWQLSLTDGTTHLVDAAVLAIGSGRPSTSWAPSELARSARFVADPWAAASTRRAAQHEDGTVVLVGAGLTMADMAMSWGRNGNPIHVVSRHGLLPLAHSIAGCERLAPPPLPDGDACSLATARRLVFGQIRSAIADGRDWRAGLDSLRPRTAELWRMLPDAERRAFRASAERRWNRARHRVEPGVGVWLEQRLAEGSLRSHTGEIVAASDSRDAVDVRLSDGQQISAQVVVNCTGPANDVLRSDDPLVRNLLAGGTSRPGAAGLGLDCDEEGRLIGSDGRRCPIWTVGPLRQGRLWESTAVPEIRTQAADLAGTVLAALPGLSARQPILAARTVA